MVTGAFHEELSTLRIQRQIEIAAPIEIAWAAVLEELGPGSQMPDGKPFPMTFEAWPGGRWFRDLGEGSGHFWGHVQVIKPPQLIEIRGPMFMSYPALNFVQYRLAADGETTRLEFLHRAMGLIPEDHQQGVNKGWDYKLQRIAEIARRLQS